MFMALNRCLQSLKYIKDAQPGSMTFGTTMFNNKLYDCIDYDITKNPVSSHFPVVRLTAALLLEIIRSGKSWIEIQAIVGDDVVSSSVCVFVLVG